MESINTHALHIEKFFSLSPDLLCIASVAGYFVKINPSFTEILGYSENELLSQPFVNLIHPEDLDKTQAELNKLENGAERLHFENRYCCKDGEYRWFSWKAYYEVETGLLYAIARDVTEKKSMEKKLILQSQQDPLTEVLNRRAFTEICARQLKQAMKDKFPLSLVIIDVDFFKEFNDSKGHLQGDTVLKKISTTLHRQLRKNTDFISRYGGDEFIVLLSHTNLKQALEVAEHLRETVEHLKIFYGQNSKKEQVTITLGVTTILPSQDYSLNELISVADKALYQAKKAGRNQVIGVDFVNSAS